MLRPRATRSGFATPRWLRAPRVAAGLALPSTAAGGVYTVAQCHQSLNPTTGQAAFEQVGIPYQPQSPCGSGNGLQVIHGANPTALDQYGAWIWRAPAGTVFTNVQAVAQLGSEGGDQAGLWIVRPGGQEEQFAGGPDMWTAHQASGDFTQFHSMLHCTPGPVCTGGLSAHADVRNVLLRTDDRTAPVASITGGSMFAAPAVRGDRAVGFEVLDQGGGVREVELRVNGETVYADVLACQVNQDVATALQPCGGAASRTVSLATSEGPFETGANRVAACGDDLALDGVPNSDCKSRNVFVDDVCPASSVGGGSKLSAKFRRGKARAKVRSDQRARLRGRLTSDSEGGIGGAKVCALTRVDRAGERYVVAKTTTTGNRGGYSLRLPPGASRKVYVHRVFGDDVLARHGLSIKARVRPSFEVAPKKKRGRVGQGERLRFRGKLPGPSCGSRVVKVQAKVGKRRWQVFRSVRTRPNCRYATRFKLRATSEPTRYLFRVRVPEQARYPYEAGASTVRVRKAG